MMGGRKERSGAEPPRRDQRCAHQGLSLLLFDRGQEVGKEVEGVYVFWRFTVSLIDCSETSGIGIG
ncbi:hypothetical protein INR49_000823 [Caranx melampygus]|nr:hypothetical protein INR49_000823 [Caranx melampygus]